MPGESRLEEADKELNFIAENDPGGIYRGRVAELRSWYWPVPGIAK